MKIIITALLFVITHIGLSQSWQSIGDQGIGYVNDIVEYNGDIYITGDFVDINGVQLNNIARWNGTSWAAVGAGLNLYGRCMAVYNNELYVGGNFTEVDGIPALNIAKWDGTAWSVVGSGLTMMGPPNDMITINDKLYIGGSTNYLCNTPNINIVQWSGSSYTTVGDGQMEYQASSFSSGVVYSLTELNGELHAAGKFDYVESSGYEGVARWDGINWYSLTAGLPSINNNDIAVLDGKITVASNIGTIYQLDGGIWLDIFQTSSGVYSTYDMIEFDNTTIICGHYNDAPKHLTNGNWSSLGSITGSPILTNFESINNELYVVGRQNFNVNGSLEGRTYVAKWTGPLSIEEQVDLTNTVYPNPVQDILYLSKLNSHVKINSIRITDMQGKIVKDISNQSNQVNISDLSPSVYFLIIGHDKGMSSIKIIKE